MPNYPSSLDSISNPTGATNQNDAGFLHSVQHGTANDILEILEARLGIAEATPQNTPLANTVLTSTADGRSKWATAPSAAINWATIPAVRAYKTATQSIGTGSSTLLTFDAEYFDTDGIHDLVTNTGRLTCKTAGKYRISANYSWTGAVGAIRQSSIKLNGATSIGQDDRPPALGGNLTSISVTTTYQLAVNDYVELWVYQDSGAAINLQIAAVPPPSLAMERIG
jgi:hypothetical protein